MSMVDATNTVSLNPQPTGFGGWLRSFFMRLFGMGGSASAAKSSLAVYDKDERAEDEEGEFVLAPCGYRIRVPHPSDIGHSVGELLPSVREGLNLLPPLPTIVTELLREIQNSNSTSSSVAEIASSDPALAASLLRTANSAAMGLARTITSISEAVSYLGFGTVKAMVIRLRLDEVMVCNNEQAAEDAEDLWVHCLAVSYAAEHIAKRLGGVDAGFVSTLGLLHDIGKLAVLAQLPDEADTLREEKSTETMDRLAIEAKILGMDHAGLGANLAAKWKLPADLIQAIRCHHRPASAFHSTDPLPLRKAIHILQIANQLTKYCYPHADQVEIETVSDEAFALLGIDPSLPKLLSEGVREAIAKAIIFAAGSTRKAATDPRRFCRPLTRQQALQVLSAPLVGEPRVTIDQELVDGMFSENATRVALLGEGVAKLDGVSHARFIAPATDPTIEKLIATVVLHQEGLELRAAIRSGVLLASKSLLANLLAISSKDENIEVAQAKINGRYTLAVRAPALAIPRRLDIDLNAMSARRVVEADMANLLNLGWFDRIAISPDGSTLLLIAA